MLIRGRRDIGEIFVWPSMKCCNNQEEIITKQKSQKRGKEAPNQLKEIYSPA